MNSHTIRWKGKRPMRPSSGKWRRMSSLKRDGASMWAWRIVRTSKGGTSCFSRAPWLRRARRHLVIQMWYLYAALVRWTRKAGVGLLMPVLWSSRVKSSWIDRAAQLTAFIKIRCRLMTVMSNMWLMFSNLVSISSKRMRFLSCVVR